MLDERELTRRLETGDRDAFKDLYRLYYADLIRISERILGDAAAAEDVVQEVFLVLMDQANSFSKVHTSLKGWLMAVVKNESHTYLKKQIREKERNMVHMHLAQPSDEPEAPGPSYEDVLKEAEKSLSEQQALIFRMSKIEKQPQDEIAKKLNISIKTVKNTMTEVYKKLRRYPSAHSHGM